MEELIRTNDLVLLSFVQSLLEGDGIEHLLLDGHMSVVEGSLGVLPRRVLVPAAMVKEARRLLALNGLARELGETDV